jgi:hypothetical protein
MRDRSGRKSRRSACSLCIRGNPTVGAITYRTLGSHFARHSGRRTQSSEADRGRPMTQARPSTWQLARRFCGQSGSRSGRRSVPPVPPCCAARATGRTTSSRARIPIGRPSGSTNGRRSTRDSPILRRSRSRGR